MSVRSNILHQGHVVGVCSTHLKMEYADENICECIYLSVSRSLVEIYMICDGISRGVRTGTENFPSFLRMFWRVKAGRSVFRLPLDSTTLTQLGMAPIIANPSELGVWHSDLAGRVLAPP